MKKFILVLALLLLPSLCFAASTKIEGANGQTNASSNPLFVQDSNISTHQYVTKTGTQNAVISGAATIYSVTLSSGGTTDTIALFDWHCTTALLSTEIVVEVEVGVANSTQQVVFPGGVKVTNGVSVTSKNNSTEIYSITYDK